MNELEAFYRHEGREDLRLKEGGVHYLEFETATRLLERHLPPASAVLDNCAGSGAYAFHLARQGHTVTAGDVVPCNVAMLEEAQKKEPLLQQIYLGDALTMPQFADASFDAVLCMGALYHQHEKEERQQAIRESLRVLKPGGLLAVTYMNRHAVILGNAKGGLENLDELLTFASDGRQGIFHASTPEETTALMAEFSLQPVCHAALDGVANFLFATAKLLNKKGYEAWKEYHFRFCETPSLLGYSYHNFYLGKKMAG